MPEYLAPGVYVEEIEIGAKPIEGVSTSTAGFLGQTERGPIEPRLITSFEDFKKLYGSLSDGFLFYAVNGFFANGGKRCFIGRIVGVVNDSFKTAKVDLKKDGDVALTVSAIGPGTWGNRIEIKIEDASLHERDKNLFKLSIRYKESEESEPKVVEVYDNLSPLPGLNNCERRVNGISNFITIKSEGIRPDNITDWVALTDGDEGSIQLEDFIGREIVDNDKRIKTGLLGFGDIDEISIVCIPDEHSVNGVTDELVKHCEKLRDRFAILQSKQSDTNIANLWPPKDSKYAAFYFPWLKIIDPLTGLPKLVPPGGHIAGIYARSDTERGVHKAPANEIVRGVVGLQFNISQGEQEILNPRGVNCIRAFPGRGIRVWGARTTSSDPLWKYINVRRLLLYLEESIEKGTQWVVFEPNDERLWARVKQSITNFLTKVWKDGALMGSTPEEAFFVKCDRTTMTQDDIDNGRLICIIGVAPVKPAEFVIFRIAQWAGGSEISE